MHTRKALLAAGSVAGALATVAFFYFGFVIAYVGAWQGGGTLMRALFWVACALGATSLYLCIQMIRWAQGKFIRKSLVLTLLVVIVFAFVCPFYLWDEWHNVLLFFLMALGF